MLADYFRFAFNNLRHRKLRSWLTMLGIFIGIAAVVALISIAQGMQVAITEQFEQLGKDKIIIEPGAVQLGPPGSGIGAKLTEDDLRTIKKVKGVEDAAGIILSISKIKFKDEISYEFVVGVPIDSQEFFEETQAIDLIAGRDVKEKGSYNAIIGYSLANNEILGRNLRLRDRIEINEVEFKVVGILDKRGNRYDDGSIVISYETAEELFDLEDEYHQILAKARPNEDVALVAEEIEKDLRRERDVEEGEEDFRVATSEQLLEGFLNVFGIIQVVVIGIAAISIVVGGIGIMNTMYTSVLERTREVGIMKAVGAKNSDILSLFLVESGLFGLAGGIIGIGLGMGISKTVEFIAQRANFGLLTAYFGWPLLLGALFFSFAIGALSGTLPALQASRMRPVEALRYE